MNKKTWQCRHEIFLGRNDWKFCLGKRGRLRNFVRE